MSRVTLLLAAVVNMVVAQTQIEQWGQLELTLSGPSAGNPFADNYLIANFSLNNEELFTVNGFYDGKGEYKIRFMPNKIGVWYYTTESNVYSMNNVSGNFTATKPTSTANFGPANVDYSTNKSFIWASSEPYLPFGTTTYFFPLFPNDTIINNTLQTLKYCAENGIFNKVRFAIFPAIDWQPAMYPYIGTPPDQWGNYNEFNVTFWKHLDFILTELHSFKAPMIISLILFHPYDEGYYGFDCMGCPYPNNKPNKCPNHTYNTHNDEFYIKYLTARVGSYRNIWYILSNEFSKTQSKANGLPNSFPTWDKLGQALQKYDIYSKEKSIHQCCGVMYNYSRQWTTHFGIQANLPNKIMADYDYSYFQSRYNVSKPVVFDEVGYEGNGSNPWDDLTVAVETDRFWMALMNGNTGCTHGDSVNYWIDNNNKKEAICWSTDGDQFGGKSAEKISWFYKFMTNKLNGVTKNFRIHPQFHEMEHYCYEYYPSYPHCNIGCLYKENEYYLIHFSNYENATYSRTINVSLGNITDNVYELSYIDYLNESITILKNVSGNKMFQLKAPYSPYNVQFTKV